MYDKFHYHHTMSTDPSDVGFLLHALNEVRTMRYLGFATCTVSQDLHEKDKSVEELTFASYRYLRTTLSLE